jgi:hypothetical protein
MNNNQIITVDAQTGEIMSIVNSMKVPIGKEPAFYKSYLEDAACLTGLTLAEVMLFRWMCMNMNYSNSIFIMKPQREEISKLYGYNKSTIDMSVTKLAKKGLIIRQSRGCYIVNPNLAAKGSWEDVKALRVTIDYMEQGRQVKVTKVDKNQLQVEEDR